MKIQPKVYTFEVGDIIAAKGHDEAAIRYFDRGTWSWALTNTKTIFDDEHAERLLESGHWFYVGNRKELAREH